MNAEFQNHLTTPPTTQASIAKWYTTILIAIFLTMTLFTSHPSNASEKSSIPKDIATFIKNRDGCDHFRGEEPYDKKRQQFLEKQMRQLCTGTDKKLKLLKLKYKSNEKIMEMLIQYEEQIESGS